MNEIEFPKETRITYDAIHKSAGILREKLICRMYNDLSPKEGCMAIGACFAGILEIAIRHKDLTHVEYNPFESLTEKSKSAVAGFGYNSVERELLEPQKMYTPALKKKEREKWLHLGKIYGIIPKGRGIDNLLKKGIKLSLDDSPTKVLGALIHMRHLWRERGFIKSVLFLMSKTNMDFWQAYVLASRDKLATKGEHTIFIPGHLQRKVGCIEDHDINILLLPALRIAHETPERFDKRLIKDLCGWDTDRTFKIAARFEVWVDPKALYDIDFKPLIYNDFLKDKGTKSSDVTGFVKELLGKKYKIKRSLKDY